MNEITQKIIKYVKLLAPTPLILKYPDLLDVWSPTVQDKINKL